MFLKLRPFFYSLLFFCGLEIIAYNHSNLNLTFFVLIILLLVSLREGKIIGKKWKFSVLPIFFTLSAVSLLYLITIKYEQQIFIFLAFGMHYLALFGAERLGKYEKDQTAKGMNMAATFATIFFAYAGAYGLYLNFLVPLYSLMLAYFLITLLVSYQYFSTIKSDQMKTAWIYSFLLGLAITEIIWTMNFWPFGYLTTGAIALILYYMLWDIVQSHFLNILSHKRVAVNAVFFSFLILLLLLTSKWIPVI
ncbi:MAG TPA: hypothetical protein DCS28_02630 [Candidatus Moranbacteria bacterium]|nr:hypothetical protein [Candidatus Moranbacteria bacterium]HAT74911.1 hypothetical protein [Candidatus Moranbacteria bacterium]